jgi:ComF family protein
LGECALCHGSDLRFTKAIAVGNYQGLLQELIIRMKGQQDESIAIQLGQMLGYELLASDSSDFDPLGYDLAIPVPSHWFRKLKRGFQAADVICESMCGLTGIKKSSSIVKAIRSTKKQGTLSSAGRVSNVRGAFSIRPTVPLAGKRVLIVDDVMTSGATTSEIARILITQGAEEVNVAVVARGARVS